DTYGADADAAWNQRICGALGGRRAETPRVLPARMNHTITRSKPSATATAARKPFRDRAVALNVAPSFDIESHTESTVGQLPTSQTRPITNSIT
ncbi:unnamed protein product, partial [Lampetra fluviatilis]